MYEFLGKQCCLGLRKGFTSYWVGSAALCCPSNLRVHIWRLLLLGVLAKSIPGLGLHLMAILLWQMIKCNYDIPQQSLPCFCGYITLLHLLWLHLSGVQSRIEVGLLQ
jgi:hypothetical protein